MALNYSQILTEHREILLKNKPQAMLKASPKGTVPVLILTDGKVLEESLDVMHWCLTQSDPFQWYYGLDAEEQGTVDQWIEENDSGFKPWLDKYKYHVGYPEHPPEFYRDQAEVFLQKLDASLTNTAFLLGDKETLADNAIFPFIRQFANVDRTWFDQTDYVHLRRWLDHFLNSTRFNVIMEKRPLWQET